MIYGYGEITFYNLADQLEVLNQCYLNMYLKIENSVFKYDYFAADKQEYETNLNSLSCPPAFSSALLNKRVIVDLEISNYEIYELRYLLGLASPANATGLRLSSIIYLDNLNENLHFICKKLVPISVSEIEIGQPILASFEAIEYKLITKSGAAISIGDIDAANGASLLTAQPPERTLRHLL